MIYFSLAYLLSASGFILGLTLMLNVQTAKKGNFLSATALGIAIITTVLNYYKPQVHAANLTLLLSLLSLGTVIGGLISSKLNLRRIPELISLFNALGGFCAMLIGLNEVLFFQDSPFKLTEKWILLSGVGLGAVSFSAGMLTVFKLRSNLKVKRNTKWFIYFFLFLIIEFSALHYFDPEFSTFVTLSLRITAVSLAIGLLIMVPINRLDLPILTSGFNTVSGSATAFVGIIMESSIMIVGGVIVMLSGILLTCLIRRNMNRTLKNILFHSIRKTRHKENPKTSNSQTIGVTELAQLIHLSKKIAIIPGFELTKTQTKKACLNLQKILKLKEIHLDFIVHPFAGKLPGLMSLLLSETNIKSDNILAMDQINHHMHEYDLALVIGAYDLVNPAAETDSKNIVSGMPIIKAYESKHVVVLKSNMPNIYADEINLLYERNNCKLLIGDITASLKTVMEELK